MSSDYQQDIDEVSVKTATAVAKREDEQEQYAAAIERLPKGVAVCDNRWPSSIMKLFFSSAVQSAALVPMKSSDDGPVIGGLHDVQQRSNARLSGISRGDGASDLRLDFKGHEFRAL